MDASVHSLIEMDYGVELTRHAWERMGGRSVSPARVKQVLRYGRVKHTRGAVIYVVGRKEVEHYAAHGIDLSDVEGVHVVCCNDRILTVYRNNNLRGLRPSRRRQRQ